MAPLRSADEGRGRTRPGGAGRAASWVALALGLALVARYMAPRLGHAWDFETFYHAAAALRAGLDPWRLESLAAVAGKPVPLPFLYPSATLALFVPFTVLPLAAATGVWLALKTGAAVLLVAFWKRWFLPATGLPALALVAVFAFNGALVTDLRVGNVAILEALLLWIAFRCYMRERRWAFACLVSLAAVPKALPIAFLALLLVPSRDRPVAVGPALAGLALWVAIVLLPLAPGGGWLAALRAGAPAVRPRGEFNPSALGVLDAVLGVSGGGAPRGPDAALLAWAVYAALLIVASLGLLRRAWRRRDPLTWVVLACPLFALLSPRMMAYSYVLLVPAAMRLVAGLPWPAPARAVALCVLAGEGVARLLLRADFITTVPGLSPAAALTIGSLPFLLTLGLWLALLLAGGRGLPAPVAAGRPERGRAAPGSRAR